MAGANALSGMRTAAAHLPVPSAAIARSAAFRPSRHRRMEERQERDEGPAGTGSLRRQTGNENVIAAAQWRGTRSKPRTSSTAGKREENQKWHGTNPRAAKRRTR